MKITQGPDLISEKIIKDKIGQDLKKKFQIFAKKQLLPDHLGKPPEEIIRLAEVIVEGGDTALAAARPGMTCGEVEEIWQNVLKRNGYQKESRVGYSIGLNYPPDWGERTASLRRGDNTVLEAGMCFHFQSGMWLKEFGAAISEPFVVTENGGERFCSVNRELIILD